MILLDTNICIAALKSDRRVLSRMVRHTGRLYLPFRVSAELRFGIEKQSQLGKDVTADRDRIDEFHTLMDGVLDMTEEVILEYARLRAKLEISGAPLSPNDTWIAAQALVEDALLITGNLRKFERVPELRTQNWLKS